MSTQPSVILQSHRGGDSPMRPWFNKSWRKKKLRTGFLYRPNIGDTPNPGSPREGSDSFWSEKLSRLFGNDCHIAYIPGRHDGAISDMTSRGTIGKQHLWLNANQLVSAYYGDGIVIDINRIPRRLRPFATTIKVCDCAPWILSNPELGLVGLMHVSVTTAFQYQRPDGAEPQNTIGPIVPRMMEAMHGKENTGKVYAVIGPTINGLLDEDHRCYPWNVAHADQLAKCIHKVYPRMSQDDFFRDHPTPGKVDINFGLMQLRLAEAEGLETRWTLDVTRNRCTCHPDYYSMREAQNAANDPFINEHDKGILATEKDHRYGNLAYLYIS